MLEKKLVQSQRAGLNDRQYELLLTKLKQDGDCLLYTGYEHPKSGYGVFLHKSAHKAYWEYNNGPVPEDKELAHSCGRRLCVIHVRPKTHSENMLESPDRPSITGCPQGHEYTPENTFLGPKGERRCKECSRTRSREYQRKKAARRK